MAVTIEDQVKEVQRELRARDHVYPRQINAGRLKPETAQRHNEHLRAALATLEFVAAHATGLRALVHYLRATGADADPSRVMTATADEREALLRHPAVAAVLDTFEGSAIDSIRIIPPPMPAQAEMFDPEEESV